MKKQFRYISLLALCLWISCSPLSKPELLSPEAFSTTVDGQEVELYTLESGKGLYMQVTNYGGRVVSLFVPDRNGHYEDVVLGFDNINAYLNNGGERFLGPVVGRFANRIANGRFELDGTIYQLPQNNHGQSLHGGLKGLDRIVWRVDSVSRNAIFLSYLSPNGEEGYPGTVDFRMSYTLTSDNEFQIIYRATTDKPTVINLSHHGLFNLKGAGKGSVLDHLLTINAHATTPVDSLLIPCGTIDSVENTPFDFRIPKSIGHDIENENEQLKHGAGYDHNWVISKSQSGVELVATLYEPNSGRVMEVWSDQPGLQFYSGNFFDGQTTGKYGRTHNYREALALETQKFPDSPNQPQFPSTRLDPDQAYSHTCKYRFVTQ